MTEAFTVAAVAPRELYELRRRVLRAGRADAVVAHPADDAIGTLHFAGRLGAQIVVSASFFVAPGPREATHQLRYMATEPAVQGRGFGRRVLVVAETTLASVGVRRVWANARDSALGFYRACGWSVLEGSEHLSAETQIPHTVILKDLGPAPS